MKFKQFVSNHKDKDSGYPACDHKNLWGWLDLDGYYDAFITEGTNGKFKVSACVGAFIEKEEDCYLTLQQAKAAAKLLVRSLIKKDRAWKKEELRRIEHKLKVLDQLEKDLENDID